MLQLRATLLLEGLRDGMLLLRLAALEERRGGSEPDDAACFKARRECDLLIPEEERDMLPTASEGELISLLLLSKEPVVRLFRWEEADDFEGRDSGDVLLLTSPVSSSRPRPMFSCAGRE